MQTILRKMDAILHGVEGISGRLDRVEAKVYSKGYTLPGADEGREKFSFAKAFFAIRNGDWSQAGYEQSIFSETRKRAMTTGSTSGGYLIPAEVMGEVIELLRAENVCMRLGARVLTNLSGSPVTWPRKTSGSTGYWVGENLPITESDIVVGQINLTPKKCACLVKVPNELAILSNPSAEQVVRADLAETLGNALDLAYLRGSGTDYQPLGITQTLNIPIVNAGTGGNSGSFLWDTASQMEGKLEDANALRGSLGFAMNPKIKRLLKRQRIQQFSGDTGGEYVVWPVLTDNALRAALGYDFATTTQFPTNLCTDTAGSEVIFGNWAELFIGLWGGLEILASNVAGDNTGGAFSSDQLWIRAIQRTDAAMRHLASFVVCPDAKVTGA